MMVAEVTFRKSYGMVDVRGGLGRVAERPLSLARPFKAGIEVHAIYASRSDG